MYPVGRLSIRDTCEIEGHTDVDASVNYLQLDELIFLITNWTIASD